MYEYKATIMGYIFEEYLICRKCLWYVKYKKGKLITNVKKITNVKNNPTKYTAILLLFVAQSTSPARVFLTPWTIACQASSLSLTKSWSAEYYYVINKINSSGVCMGIFHFMNVRLNSPSHRNKSHWCTLELFLLLLWEMWDWGHGI